MVRQELLPNSIFLFLFIVILGCREPKSPKDLTAPILIKVNSSENFQLVNDIKFLNGKAFTGQIFTLYRDSKDTLSIKFYLEGKEHGQWNKFYKNGQLSEKRCFENGKKVGEFIAWWPNGKKQLDYWFKNDEYEGTCKEWGENGVLMKEMNYSKGYENGSQKWWYENGKIRANYVIINGRRYGLLGTKNCTNVSDSIFKK